MVGFLKLVLALVVAIVAASLLFGLQMTVWQYLSSATTAGDQAIAAIGVGGMLGYGSLIVFGALITLIALPTLGVVRLMGRLTAWVAVIFTPLVLVGAGVAFIVLAGATAESWPLLATLVLPGALAGWLLWRIGLRPRPAPTAA